MYNSLNKLNGPKYHSFHMVDSSPWPFMMSFAVLMLTMGASLYFHKCKLGGLLLALGFCLVIFTMFVWFRDVVSEGTFGGYHTSHVQLGLIYGMVLFMVSEVMFFAAFFWAFFHSSLAPTLEIGGTWPPYLLWNCVMNPFDVPLLNTIILLISGATITWAHHSILEGCYSKANLGFIFTMFLALLFMMAQGMEYVTSMISMSDGIYGSCFFMLTGFHGFHVMIGTLFMSVCFLSHMKCHFTKEHHVGFTSAAWYWHFVDVVWLFLFIFVYVWGHWEPTFIL